MSRVSQLDYGPPGRREARVTGLVVRLYAGLRALVPGRSAAVRRIDPRITGLSVGRVIALAAAMLLATLAVATEMVLERTRQTTMHGAEVALQNASLIVESTINRQFLQVDQLLASLPALLATTADRSGDVGLDGAARMLRGLNFQTFVFRDIMLVRPDGTVWSRARPNLGRRPVPVSVADLTNGASPGSIVVAGPVRNAVTGDWALYLARPIALPGVGPLIAVAEVPLPLITEMLSAVGSITGQRISVERKTGELMATVPHDELRIGRQQLPLITAAQANGRAYLVAEPGRAPVIQAARATLYGEVVVAVTLDQDIALADWLRDRNRLYVGFALTALFIVGLAGGIYVVLRQRERTEAERARARAMLDSAIASMSDGFVMWDPDDRLVICNETFRDMYKVSAPFIHRGALFEDILRQGITAGQYPQATGDVEAFVRKSLALHRADTPPIERELPDGRWILITERETPDGGVVGIRTDITQIKKTSASLQAARDRATRAIGEVQKQNAALTERDRALRKQNVLFDAALNNMSQGLLMTDRDQRLIVCNNRFFHLFGLAPGAIVPGMTMAEVCETIERVGSLDAQFAQRLAAEQERLTASRESGMFVAASADGRALAVSQRPLSDGGWVATYDDVTEQRQAEERIRYTAHHDALTKLPNRLLFRNSLDAALRLPGEDGEALALLYLDLDKFKNVNDTLGHPVGDALLEAAARRLQGCVRDGDIVARLGGDEFAIIYVSDDMPRSARHLGDRIIAALSAPYDLAGHNVVVGASVGIAIAGEDGNDGDGIRADADTLLKNADLALYQAKEKGRGKCCVFERDMEAQLHARLAVEEDLRGALDRQEFEVLYQPLFDLATDRVSGFEALLRWNHPTRGVVAPLLFIHLAEEIGLINGIGAWVLQRACADAALFPDDVKIAVNLSPAQLRGSDIVDIVAGALSGSGLRPSRLELEITETALLNNNETTVALLLQLKTLGLRIALDDFGTGYSSLSYLRSFPFDKIKIDQSFVRDMATRQDSAAIVSSVVGLANKLDMMTTAEGVETIDQLAMVRDLGCSEAQGYLFGVPRPISDVLDFFAESPTRRVGMNAGPGASTRHVGSNI